MGSHTHIKNKVYSKEEYTQPKQGLKHKPIISSRIHLFSESPNKYSNSSDDTCCSTLFSTAKSSFFIYAKVKHKLIFWVT